MKLPVNTLSEHDLDEFNRQVAAAAEEHAHRALRSLAADIDLLLARHEASDQDNPIYGWAACLLVKALSKEIPK